MNEHDLAVKYLDTTAHNRGSSLWMQSNIMDHMAANDLSWIKFTQEWQRLLRERDRA